VSKVNTNRCLRQSGSAGSGAAFAGIPSDGVKSILSNTSVYSQPNAQSNILSVSAPIQEINTSTSGLDSLSTTSSFGQALNNLGGSGGDGQQQNFTEKPRGILVAHLHEHRNSILKICPMTKYKGLFASCSRENVRIWDAEKMEGRNVANRWE
jgi:hypothetical protein